MTTSDAQPIQRKDNSLVVPDRPIVPFIEGDGTGRDIWRASVRVFDAAVEKAYRGRRPSPASCVARLRWALACELLARLWRPG